MEHIISVLVENKFGVLARVAGLFSARGYNIESLSVAPTLDPTTSMITIVTVGDDRIIEQIMKQLNKVVEVLKVVDLTEMRFLDRETALIKVHTKPEHRDEAIRLADIFRAKIVDSSPNTYTIEITGDVDKVEAMISMLQPLGIKDLVRTGRIAIARETTRTASPRREPALMQTGYQPECCDSRSRLVARHSLAPRKRVNCPRLKRAKDNGVPRTVPSVV